MNENEIKIPDLHQIVLLLRVNPAVFDVMFRVRKDQQWHQIRKVQTVLKLDIGDRILHPGKQM